MTQQAGMSGDAVSQVNEILNDAFGAGETQDEHNKDADDYTPDVENAGDADLDVDEETHDEDENLDEEQDDQDADEDQDQDEDDVDEDEEQSVENISQLAEYLESDESTIYSLEVPMGDGLEPVTISQLKDSYMSMERDRKQFADDQKQFDIAVRQQQAVWEENQKLPEFNKNVLTAATNVLAIQQADANFDWEALERENPTQAILQKQKLNEALQLAQQEYQDSVKSLEDARQRSFSQMKQYEKAKTLEAIPEWADPAAYQKDADVMGSLLADYGFGQEEVANVYDHRLTKLVRDFVMLKAEKDSANTTVKKLRVVPKKLKQKTTSSKKVGNKIALKRKVANAKSSRDDRVKASAVTDLINSI